jgi:hypothetical protein
MATHTPILRPDAALMASEIQRRYGLGVRGPTSHSPGRRTHCIEGFVNGVRRREGERLVRIAACLSQIPRTWHRSPCSPGLTVNNGKRPNPFWIND